LTFLRWLIDSNIWKKLRAQLDQVAQLAQLVQLAQEAQRHQTRRCMSACRLASAPSTRLSEIGFRLAAVQVSL
jgi:hypothetical protein